MSVYFMQAVNGGPVKIGCSNDVERRRRQLEKRYGQPLAILAVLPGNFEDEEAIHERFSHLRFGRSEQFRPAPELMDFIQRPLFVNQTPVNEPMEPTGHGDGARTAYIQIRSTTEWRDWVIGLAEADRSTVAELIDRALADYARRRKHEIPPPKR